MLLWEIKYIKACRSPFVLCQTNFYKVTVDVHFKYKFRKRKVFDFSKKFLFNFFAYRKCKNL